MIIEKITKCNLIFPVGFERRTRVGHEGSIISGFSHSCVSATAIDFSDAMHASIEKAKNKYLNCLTIVAVVLFYSVERRSTGSMYVVYIIIR